MDLDVLRADDDAAAPGAIEVALHLTGGEIMHDPREIAVAAERDDEGQAIANTVAAAGHDRKPAGKADAQHADAAVGRQRRLLRRPVDRILDDVGHRGRDAKALQIGRGHSDHGKSGRGEVLGQADEPSLVDPVAMHAGHQDDGAAEGTAGR